VGAIGKKPIIGILGGIGSGKSTVAAEFAKLGCKVIDADKIAHELLDEPAVKEKVVGLFGQDILDPAGKIDREKLAEVVFADARKLSPAALGSEQNSPLARINEIIHPLVLQRAQELINQYDCQNQVKAIVLDMPLLVEVGWDKRCDKLIFVDCRQELRLDRAKKLGFDKNQVKIRENFQISLDNKANLADNTIENNSDFSVLAKQVVNIFSNIMYNG
jgi:dephospho-CoA kinase